MSSWLLTAVIVGATAIVLTFLWVWIAKRLSSLEQGSLTADDLATLVRPEQLEAQVKRLLDSDQRILSSTTETFGKLNKELGTMQEASRQLLELGRDIAGLEQLLKPPQLRGGIGEIFLEQLLAQVLADQQYELQHRFSDGSRVDAVVVLAGGLVPIDAKFPLEAFRRLLDAENDAERTAARRDFLRAVKGHVDDIAAKYIRPDEGTFEFALMYIPAENVYYEAVLMDPDGELFSHALERRVVPVSPNSLYAYLLVIVHGLRGMHIEEKAKDILRLLERLEGELEHFQEDYRVLGTHLQNARVKYEDGERQLRRIEDKLLSATEAQLELPETSQADQSSTLSDPTDHD